MCCSHRCGTNEIPYRFVSSYPPDTTRMAYCQQTNVERRNKYPAEEAVSIIQCGSNFLLPRKLISKVFWSIYLLEINEGHSCLIIEKVTSMTISSSENGMVIVISPIILPSPLIHFGPLLEDDSNGRLLDLISFRTPYTKIGSSRIYDVVLLCKVILLWKVYTIIFQLPLNNYQRRFYVSLECAKCVIG